MHKENKLIRIDSSLIMLISLFVVVVADHYFCMDRCANRVYKYMWNVAEDMGSIFMHTCCTSNKSNCIYSI